MDEIKMDLEIEVGLFYDWLETNPDLGVTAIALWLSLVDSWRKARYPDMIAVAISTLEAKTRLSASAIETARTALVDSGRIEWHEQSEGRTAMYKIIPLQTQKKLARLQPLTVPETPAKSRCMQARKR